MHFANTRPVPALLVLIAKGVVAAEDDKTEFAFNLFSDIAPILALFGEQFARQFLSESFTWLDHLIFACVPLGILTALTGAIRVQGPKIARSFIGRARENRATAEIEFMSSTSQEVCEMFNGKGIIRTMGRPEIAQFVIFPDIYNTFAKTPNSSDQSCGIHTLQTAVESEVEGDSIMIHDEYHSKSYRMAANLFKRRRSRASKEDDVEKHAEPLSSLSFKAHDVDKDVDPPSSLASSAHGQEKDAELPPSLDFLGPPNLQLNVSSGSPSKERKDTERFCAAIATLMLQISLIVIAVVTVHHEPTKRKIGYEPQLYGLPCYVAGSVLLTIGMTLCSCAIESSTVEFWWKRPKSVKGTHPQLIWLQKSQRVSDQAFDSFAILGGPKRYVMTSSREDDVQRCKNSIKEQTLGKTEKPDDSSIEGKLQRPKGMKPKTNGTMNYSSTGTKAKQQIKPTMWEVLTLVGVFSGGLGFIAQFMGLRGLAWPCSISQLVAIFLMALIRALIRRKIGRIPLHCRALPMYELDYLATRIVFKNDFREFEEGKDPDKLLETADPKNICSWRVVTADPDAQRKFRYPVSGTTDSTNPSSAAKSAQTEDMKHVNSASSTKSRNSTYKADAVSVAMPAADAPNKNRSFSASNEEPGMNAPEALHRGPSQQLVRVRERLGNLCRWDNNASDAALALAKSIENFLATFFPEPYPPSPTSPERRFEWVIETTKVTEDGICKDEKESVVIVLKESTKDKRKRWTVELGKLEAILSLWLASTEAEMLKDSKLANGQSSGPANIKPGDGLADWRRSRAGAGSKMDYYRIIGDDYDDNVLRRDISWWVGEQFEEQVEKKSGDQTLVPPEGSETKRIGEQVEEQQGHLESGHPKLPLLRGDGNKLTIGFNGPSKGKTARTNMIAKELFVVSSAYLPVIFAQHLFTSFMWTVAEKLPWESLHERETGIINTSRVISGDTFDLYALHNTWYRIKLSNFRVDSVVKYAESAGLGRASDILLCMVPALSFYDLLPNERMLSVMPRHFQQIQSYGWAKTASFYHDLLDSSKGADVDDFFAIAAVAQAMEFIYLAYEPFTEDIRPDEELEQELEKLIACLTNTFATVLEKLSLVYGLQRRHDDFRTIFDYYAERGARYIPKVKFSPWEPKERTKEEVRFLEMIGITDRHISACKSGENSEKSKAKKADEKLAPKPEGIKEADMFGWTVLHYAAAWTDLSIQESVLKAAEGDPQPIDRWLDEFKRSPIHLAALHGNDSFLRKMLAAIKQKQSNAKIAVKARGLDGMTPIHLAVKGRHEDCIKTLLKENENIPTETDVWGRAPIHLAAVTPDIKISEALLNKGARTDLVDTFERTPLTYLKFMRDKSDIHDVQKDMATRFMQLWKDFDTKDDNGMTVLHYAVEFLNSEIIKTNYLVKNAPIATDKKGRTPLHAAVLAERGESARAVVKVLLGYNPKMSAKDSWGMTPLMIACQTGQIAVAEDIMEKIGVQDERDNTGRTALHHAIESKKIPAESLERIVSKFANIINVPNLDSQTPLYLAVEAKNETASLILLKQNADPGIGDVDGRTPLILAAIEGSCLGAVEYIIQNSPKVVNQGDAEYDESPIAWACEKGNIATVKLLLDRAQQLEPNRPARKWGNRTPLHIALSWDRSEIVEIMLKDDRVAVYPDTFKRSSFRALQFAISESSPAGIKLMLLHSRTSTATRIAALRVLAGIYYDENVEIFNEVLNSIDDTLFPSSDLDDLVQRFPRIDRHSMALSWWLQRAQDPKEWGNLKHPLHTLARIGEREVLMMLLSLDLNIPRKDADNWTLIDVAKRNNHSDIENALKPHFANDSSERLPYARPSSFLEDEPNVSLETCSGCTIDSSSCTAAWEIKVNYKEPISGNVCLRTQESIPPDTAWFYFEVKIITRPDSKRHMNIGFTQLHFSDDQYIGMREGTWAYHADDGDLYAQALGKEMHVGGRSEIQTYGAGDTVGCGLNMTTGEGYRTYNGKKLDSGNTFEEHKFNIGKVYPCIGIHDDKEENGLHLRVILGKSTHHEFVYKGDEVQNYSFGSASPELHNPIMQA